MKYLESDSEYDYFTSYFQGIEVLWRKDKKTQEFLMNSDDGARCLGFENMADLLRKHPELVDKFLDGINNGLVDLGKTIT